MSGALPWWNIQDKWTSIDLSGNCLGEVQSKLPNDHMVEFMAIVLGNIQDKPANDTR